MSVSNERHEIRVAGSYGVCSVRDRTVSGVGGGASPYAAILSAMAASPLEEAEVATEKAQESGAATPVHAALSLPVCLLAACDSVCAACDTVCT